MNRNAYNLSHLSHTAGHIGRLQSISIIPIEAGASLEVNIDGIARLAPNRKEIVSECQVDICAFFVPHRIVYGQQWIDFINAGPDEAATFTGIAIAGPYRNPEYLTLPTCPATLNRSLLNGYNRIYHNFYAVPSFSITPDAGATLVTDYDWYPTTEAGAANTRKYGRLCARLPHVLNGGNQVENTSVGWEAQDLEAVDRQVPVTAGVFDLTDLAQIQSRYKSESQSAWFAHFYQDVMREKFGSKLGKDVDPRNLMPEMLGRSTSFMSGTDIDGTDDATMGTFQGKTLDRVRFNMPRKFFGEHGNIYILALLRYPLVQVNEVHPLHQDSNFTYDYIVADPERWANLPPQGFSPGSWLAGGSNLPVIPGWQDIQEPYGQWYRFQNNRVHSNFATIPGYPFSNNNSATPVDWFYHSDEEYKRTFQTTQIGQWQIQAAVKATKFSNTPGVTSSIFAGT